VLKTRQDGADEDCDSFFKENAIFSVVHIEVVGGLESFHLKVMHFIAAKRANLTNLRLIPLRSSSNEVSPNKISLEPG